MKKLKPYKGHLGLYALLTIAIIVAMLFLRNCNSNTASTYNIYHRAEGDTINVAIEISPISYSLSTDTVGGFYYDLLCLISKKHGIKFKFHKFVPLNIAIEGLNNNFFDIVVADIPSTSDLKDRFLLTEPIYIDRQVLVQQKKDNQNIKLVQEHQKLSFDSVWVVANSPSVERIRNLSQEIGCDTIFVIQDESYSSEQLVMLTAIGEIKQAVVSEKIALSMLKDYPQLDINTKISFNQFQSWLLNKENTALCNQINTLILNTKNTPEYEQLYQRYFNNKKRR